MRPSQKRAQKLRQENRHANNSIYIGLFIGNFMLRFYSPLSRNRAFCCVIHENASGSECMIFQWPHNLLAAPQQCENVWQASVRKIILPKHAPSKTTLIDVV